jgi:hypothetical protein
MHCKNKDPFLSPQSYTIKSGKEKPMGDSKLLSELKKERRQSHSALDPGRKMMAAFSLSMEARKLFVAGLKSRGFSETEVLQILKMRRR